MGESPVYGTLVLQGDGQDNGSFRIKKRIVLIGSDQKVNIRLKQNGISRFHVSITVDSENKLTLKNLAKANNVFVNWQVVQESTILTHGDVLQIGRQLFRFEDVNAASSKQPKRAAKKSSAPVIAPHSPPQHSASTVKESPSPIARLKQVKEPKTAIQEPSTQLTADAGSLLEMVAAIASAPDPKINQQVDNEKDNQDHDGEETNTEAKRQIRPTRSQQLDKNSTTISNTETHSRQSNAMDVAESNDTRMTRSKLRSQQNSPPVKKQSTKLPTKKQENVPKRPTAAKHKEKGTEERVLDVSFSMDDEGRPPSQQSPDSQSKPTKTNTKNHKNGSMEGSNSANDKKRRSTSHDESFVPEPKRPKLAQSLKSQSMSNIGSNDTPNPSYSPQYATELVQSVIDFIVTSLQGLPAQTHEDLLQLARQDKTFWSAFKESVTSQRIGPPFVIFLDIVGNVPLGGKLLRYDRFIETCHQ